jgi:hypothetical protein
VLEHEEVVTPEGTSSRLIVLETFAQLRNHF